MTRIRLKRMGGKKKPFYRIVVADARTGRDGRYIESLGHYNPLVEPFELKVDAEKARFWLARGAQPSETVARLLQRAGVLEAPPGAGRGG